MLDYRLQTFLTLCETMHYTRAAERLCITQPCRHPAHPLFGAALRLPPVCLSGQDAAPDHRRGGHRPFRPGYRIPFSIAFTSSSRQTTRIISSAPSFPPETDILFHASMEQLRVMAKITDHAVPVCFFHFFQVLFRRR